MRPKWQNGSKKTITNAIFEIDLDNPHRNLLYLYVEMEINVYGSKNNKHQKYQYNA